MIFVFLADEECNSHNQSHCLRRSDSQPDSVDPEKERQQADSGNLEYQRA